MMWFVGCSSMQGSLGLGVGSGIVLGAGAGALVDGGNKRHMAIQGALVGGVLGGAISYLVQKRFERKEDEVRKDTLFNLEKFNVLSPIEKKRKSVPKKSFNLTNEVDE